MTFRSEHTFHAGELYGHRLRSESRPGRRARWSILDGAYWLIWECHSWPGTCLFRHRHSLVSSRTLTIPAMLDRMLISWCGAMVPVEQEASRAKGELET